MLPCGPRRSSPHIPCRTFASSPWRSRCSPRGKVAHECSPPETPGRHRCRCRKRARGDTAGGSGCSSNAAGDGGTGWPANGLSAVPHGYPYQQMPPLGYGQQYPQQYQQGISSRTSRCRSSRNPWAQADASAALPTVAANFSTANAADAEFSTTSSSNDVS